MADDSGDKTEAPTARRREEAREQGSNQMRADIRRCGHAQDAVGLLRFAALRDGRVTQAGDVRRRSVREHEPRLGERWTPRHAPHQRHAELVFEPCDGATHRRLRDAELLCGGAERARIATVEREQ